MASFAYVLPVLPGKEEAGIEGLERLMNEDPDGVGEWHRSAGIRRHAVWHQRTPGGTLAIVLFEAEDMDHVLREAATSNRPFARRFREFVRDVHGIDLEGASLPPVRPVTDWRA